MKPIAKAIDLKKIYGEGDTEVCALDGVNFEIQQGEFAAILGASVSGKSTLLNIMGGLDCPTSGEVWIDGNNLAELNDEMQTVFRRQHIGFIFQNYNLIPVMTVYENIVLPIHLDGKQEDEAYVAQILELLGLNEKKHQLPSQLSGGQQQRVAIARALASKPAIILADEPTGNLDSKTTEQVMELLKKSAMTFQQTIVMITHNHLLTKYFDRVFVMSDGKLSEMTNQSLGGSDERKENFE